MSTKDGTRVLSACRKINWLSAASTPRRGRCKVQQRFRKEHATTTASANHGEARNGSVDSACATDKFTDRVTLSQRGRVALVRLSWPDKRNVIDGKMVEVIRSAFNRLPKETCAVVMHAEGDHFCAGVDLSELAKHRTGSRAFFTKLARGPGAGDRGTARQCCWRRARAGRRRPHSCRGTQHLLCSAGGNVGHIRRRRRRGG